MINLAKPAVSVSTNCFNPPCHSEPGTRPAKATIAQYMDADTDNHIEDLSHIADNNLINRVRVSSEVVF